MTPTAYQNLCDQVLKRAAEQPMTKQQVADACAVSWTTVYRWYNHQRTPDPTTIQKLIDHLGLQAEFILH